MYAVPIPTQGRVSISWVQGKEKGVRKLCLLAEGTFQEEVPGTQTELRSSYSVSQGAHRLQGGASPPRLRLRLQAAQCPRGGGSREAVSGAVRALCPLRG